MLVLCSEDIMYRAWFWGHSVLYVGVVVKARCWGQSMSMCWRHVMKAGCWGQSMLYYRERCWGQSMLYRNMLGSVHAV